MTEFFTNHFRAFENQILLLIPQYYTLLTGEDIDMSDNEKWHEKVLNYFRNLPEKPWLIDYIESKEKDFTITFDFVTHVNIIQVLYELHQRNFLNGKTRGRSPIEFELSMSKTISKEIILFRNKLAHEFWVRDEMIQRLFEDFYFYLRCVCVSVPQIKNVLTDYSKKDIWLQLKNSMTINLQKDAFCLDKNYYNNFCFPKCNFNYQINESDIDLHKSLIIEEIKALYDNCIPTKLMEFKCYNNQDENNIDEENEMDAETLSNYPLLINNNESSLKNESSIGNSQIFGHTKTIDNSNSLSKSELTSK